MGLPTRTTLEDIKKISGYLASKPTGATVSEAKRIIDSKHLDGRKIAALKQWGLIAIDDGRMKLTDDGRLVAKAPEAGLKQFALAILRRFLPYWAILERAVHKSETSFSSSDVAAYWHEHFRAETSENEAILNDQAVCCFQLVEAAGLGVVRVGRRGAKTRIEFNLERLRMVVDSDTNSENPVPAKGVVLHAGVVEEPEKPNEELIQSDQPKVAKTNIQPTRDKVFLTHGKNRQIVEQLKEIVKFGKFVPIVAEEQETTSRPVPTKVMNAMRDCFAGIVHISSEETLLDSQGNKHHKINENVLIEIGAAFALYGENVILLVEKGVHLPSNLQGLYECRYEGEKLDGESTMKLLKTFNGFSS